MREPTIMAAIVSPLYAYALSLGYTADQLEACSGVSATDLIVPENRIPEADLGKLWQAVARKSPGKAVAIDFVRGAPMTSIAGMAYSARYAGSVRQIFELIIRNQAYASEGCHLSLEEQGDTATFTVSNVLGDELRLAQICLLGICFRTLTEVLELQVKPRKVEVSGAPDGNTSEYSAFFDAPVRFFCPRIALTLDRAVLDVPSKFQNDTLLKFTETFFRQTLKPTAGTSRDTEFARLLDAVAINAARGEFSSSIIARSVGWSARTAQRVAARRGTTLGTLVRDARFSRIEQLLKDSRVSLVEVAYFAGYSDDRAFRRAFKAKHGQTPSEYRRTGSLDTS